MNTQPQNTVDKSILFEGVYTKQDLLLFYKEVDQIIARLFIDGGTLPEKMGEFVSPEKRQQLLHFLELQKIDVSKPIAVQEGLMKIKKLGETLPVVTLELPFEPTESILKKITSWFLHRFGIKVLLDVSLERSLVGGAYIAFNGLYKNYTLRSKVNSLFDRKTYI